MHFSTKNHSRFINLIIKITNFATKNKKTTNKHMRKFVLALVAIATLQMSGAIKIVALSDIHAMSEKLVPNKGEAIDAYASTDMRMIKESAEILRTVVQHIIKQKPDIVMISGDLTKDGERLSHEFVTSQLELLRAKDIKVLVIPGNHDISNANAKIFDGKNKRDAATITRKEFEQLYQHFGYGNEVKRDTASLSYVAEPVKGLVVIGIDSNRDEENLLKSRGDSVNTYHTEGRIKESTLNWISLRAREARSQGKQVVAMMHHHLIEHFDSEARILEKYVVAQHEEVRNALIDAGVHTILTGHLHLTDIARDYNNGDSITEVATGSLITYPFHYRTITIDGSKMTVHTNQVKSVTSNKNLLAEGKKHVENAVPKQMESMLGKLMGKLDSVSKKLNGMMAMFGGGNIDLSRQKKGIMEVCHLQFDDVAKKAFIALYEGNEGKNPQSKEVVEQMEEGLKAVLNTALPAGIGSMVQGFLMENAMPQFDNLLRSMMEDRNHCGTPQEVVVDDLKVTFKM